MTVRAVFSMSRPDRLVSSRYSDSGVVIRMCGGCLIISRRAFASVSPVRTATRTASDRPSPASGRSRFWRMSLPSAFRGETYTMRRPSASAPASSSLRISSRKYRNAASVLPEPVGEEISASRPSEIACQPMRCASVGVPTEERNHSRVFAENICILPSPLRFFVHMYHITAAEKWQLR